MALNWCKSQEVLPGCVFCLQFVVWTVYVYFKYYMASTFVEMLSQASLLFFLFSSRFFVKSVCISSLGKRPNVSLVEYGRNSFPRRIKQPQAASWKLNTLAVIDTVYSGNLIRN